MNRCHRSAGILTILFLCAIAYCETIPPRPIGKGNSISHFLPPPRLAPSQMPFFQRGGAQMGRGHLDQYEWTFVDSLVDFPSAPERMEAVPTGIQFYPTSRQGYISTLHTIFMSIDGGFHWKNVRPTHLIWRPDFIYGLAAFSEATDEIHDNTLFICYSNSISGQGFIRSVRLTPFLSSVKDFADSTLEAWWQWVGNNTGYWSLTERPGWLRIYTHGSMDSSVNNATNPVLRIASGENFLIETKLEFEPEQGSGAGLIFFQDGANFVNIGICNTHEGVKIRSHSEIDDTLYFRDGPAGWNSAYLRIWRSGDNFATYASSDSIVWIHVATWSQEFGSMITLRNGMWAWNNQPDSVQPADFDYFKVEWPHNWSVQLNPVMKETDYWLGHIIAPDSMHMNAFGSWDGYALYSKRRWSGGTYVRDWTETFIDPFGWVTGPMAFRDGFFYLAGVRQWMSYDSGLTWEIRPSADDVFDGGVTFVDTLYGWTGGGRIQPESQGWVHRTTNSGLTWSGRLLETDYPIRTVHFITRKIGFAAGGNYMDGIGGIWSTTDGGLTWHEDMILSAEITVIGSRRYSPAYIDVFAAGFYPDFVGGVWHRRVFIPDTSGAVLFTRPDTLDFGFVLPGERDTLSCWAVNGGSQSITITELHIGETAFRPYLEVPIELPMGDSVEIQFTFSPDSVGSYQDTMIILNSDAQIVQVICRGNGGVDAIESHEQLLPQEPDLSVYPNPGNPNFHMTFTLPKRADIHLVVYNVLGQRVTSLAQGSYKAGVHHVNWSAQDFPSGIYFVRLEGISSPQTRKLCLIR